MGSKIPTFPPSARPTLNGISKFGFRQPGIPKPTVTALPPILNSEPVRAFPKPISEPSAALIKTLPSKPAVSNDPAQRISHSLSDQALKPVAHSATAILPEESRARRPSAAVTPEEALSTHDLELWHQWLRKPVLISGVKKGILLYFGTVHFAPGYFCGVQLDEPEGKHDGCLDGKRYYSCMPNHGVFAPVSKVEFLSVPTSPGEHMDDHKAKLSASSRPFYSRPQRSTDPSPTELRNGVLWKELSTVSLSPFVNSSKSDLNRTFSTYGAGSMMEFCSPNLGNTTITLKEKTTDLCSQQLATNTVTSFTEKPSRFDDTFKIEDENATFNVSKSNTSSPMDDRSNCSDVPLDREGASCNPHHQNLYEITEDDVEESSLGLLTPNQMLDFSFCNDMSAGGICRELGGAIASIPKTHSCDDINDLPEEEVVEDITVEYVKSSAASIKNQIVSHRHEYLYSPGRNEESSKQFRSASTPMTKASSIDRPTTLVSPVTSNDKPTTKASLESSPVSLTSDVMNISAENLSMLDDQQISLCNITYDKSTLKDYSPPTLDDSSEIGRQFQLPADKAEQLVALLKGIPIGEALLRTLKVVDVTKMGDIPKSLQQERANVLENAAAQLSGKENDDFGKRFQDFRQKEVVADGLEMTIPDIKDSSIPMTKSVEWSNEVTAKKSRLVLSTGSLSEQAMLEDTMSIEKVMEHIQREGELYKNRPASTYTVGSADTGYQGDAEYDLQSDIGTTAGSPCGEDGKHLSLSSQDALVEDGADTMDKMVKSGHTSDSDFFTDQGGTSETDGEMKQSLTSSLDGGCSKPLTGIAEDEDDELETSGMDDTKIEKVRCEDEKAVAEVSMNANLEVTVVEKPDDANDEHEPVDMDRKEEAVGETSQSSATNSRSEGPGKASSKAGSPSQETAPKDESSPLSGKSVRTRTTPKRPQVVVSKAAPVKVVGVSKIKALLEAQAQASEEAAAKRATRGPKKSRWDAVTAKISQEDKEKPKVREIRSRINTNLAGARQQSAMIKRQDSQKDNEGSVASGHRSPSSKSQTITAATDSILPLDPNSRGSSGATDDAPDGQAQDPNSRASTNNSNRDGSCATSELGSTHRPTSSNLMGLRAASPTALSERSMASSKFSHPALRLQSKIAIRAMNLAGPGGATGSDTRRTVQAKISSAQPPAPGALTRLRQKDVLQNRPSRSSNVASMVPPASARLRPSQALAKVDELSKEVQRLGALCEARTKELNMVKLQTKHATLGFDAFGVLVKYLVGELDAFSHPDLVAEIHKTKEQLITLEAVLNQYEVDVEEMKKAHSEQMNTLATQLAHSEEEVLKVSNALTDANNLHVRKIRELNDQHERETREVQNLHVQSIEHLNANHNKQIQDTRVTYDHQLVESEQAHQQEKQQLQTQLDILQQKYEALEVQAKSFEEALNKDTDSKIQWISTKNSELQKEVDSLKSVLDMKQAEIHSLRNENMKMKKALDELTLERHRVKKLQARNEELQALLREKVKFEKRLSFEHQSLKDQLEQDEKHKQALTMENEELQWKLKNSLECSSLLNMSIEGNVISWIATPEITDRIRSMRMMSSAPLTPFHESPEDQMSRSLPNFSDESRDEASGITRKLSYNEKPKLKRPSKSCSASPRKSFNRSRSVNSSTPMVTHHIQNNKLLELSHCDIDESLNEFSGPSSRSLESPQSLTELHFKACLHVDAMEEMAQMTSNGISSTHGLLRSPDALSTDSGGAGGCSSLASSSSVAEDGMSASISSVEPDDNGLIPDLDGVFSPRSEAGEAMTTNDVSPVSSGRSPSGLVKRPSEEFFVEYSNSSQQRELLGSCSHSPEYNSSTNKLNSQFNHEHCYCDDIEINSEPE